MDKMRTTANRVGAGIVVAVSLGLVSGCSAISQISDAIPEVTVDDDGGSVTLKDDDGESVTIDSSADGEIPEWFPQELPLPENYSVMSASEAEYGDESLKAMGMTTPDDIEAVVAAIDEGLADAGLQPETRQVGDMGGMKTAMFAVSIDDEGWMINAVDYGDGEDVGLTYATVNGEG